MPQSKAILTNPLQEVIFLLNHRYTLPTVSIERVEIAEKTVYFNQAEDEFLEDLDKITSFFGVYEDYSAFLLNTYELQFLLSKLIKKDSLVFAPLDVYKEVDKDLLLKQSFIELEYESRVGLTEDRFSELFKATDTEKVLLLSDFSPFYGFFTDPEVVNFIKEQTSSWVILNIRSILTDISRYNADIFIIPTNRMYVPLDAFLVIVKKEHIARLKQSTIKTLRKTHKPLVFVVASKIVSILSDILPSKEDIKTQHLEFIETIDSSIRELFSEPYGYEVVSPKNYFMYVLKTDQTAVEEFRRFLVNKPLFLETNPSEGLISLGLGLYNTVDDIQDFLAIFEEFLNYILLK